MRNYKINDKYVINMLFGDISHDGHGQFDIFTILSKVDRDCHPDYEVEIIELPECSKYIGYGLFYE